jgi:hypothetical protein
VREINMPKMKLIFPTLLSLASLTSCHPNNSPSTVQSNLTLNKDSTNRSPKSDSAALVSLLQEVFKWHDKNQSHLPDFDIIVKDSFQTGLNFESFNKTFDAITKTDFFSASFLNNYKNIGAYINNKLTNANPKYQNEINFPCQDADSWTGFQDDEPKFWNNLKITDYKAFPDSASFMWWIKMNDWSSEKSPVKFLKENGKWKVSYLEGFDMERYCR